MRAASIDMGSNSVRLLVAEVAAGGRVTPLRHERAVTRLAGGMSASGRLNPHGIGPTIAALAAYARMARDAGAEVVVAAATSAMREAADAPEVIGRIRAEAGLDVRVLTGAEEAEATARGVLSSGIAAHSAIIVDMGGGSTECIAWDSARVIHASSTPVGVVRLHERFIASDPPRAEELAALREAARGHARDIIGPALQALGPGATLIGTAGTVTTLAAMALGMEHYDRARVQGYRLDMAWLRETIERISRMTMAERSAIAGLEPARADLIIPGIALTIELTEAVGGGCLLVSDFGLLEGLLAIHAGGI